MNHHSNKVHSSQGTVPFSWENQPGISKVTYNDEYPIDHEEQYQQHGFKLPLPPCPSDSPKVIGQVVDLHIPLPPCPFQPLTRSNSSSRKVLRRHADQDPFLAAYKECTKSTKNVHRQSNLFKINGKKGGDDDHHESRGILKRGFIFSCKKSCGVREDSLIRSHQVSPPVVKESYYWKENGSNKDMLQ